KIKLLLLSAHGSSIIVITAQVVPTRIKGILLPILVLTLSDKAPISGNRNKARTLSRAIITPVIVSLNWNVLERINGIKLSYSCQKALIERKARPIKNVRL